MIFKRFVRQDRVQIAIVCIIGGFFLINPLGRMFGVNNTFYDDVKIVKQDNTFLKCEKTTPQTISMGGIITQAQTANGVIALFTNSSISDYHEFLCLEIVESKKDTKSITLKPHPKLDVDQLTSYKTIQVSEVPTNWKASAPFAGLHTH
jgi:hypothetical protein